MVHDASWGCQYNIPAKREQIFNYLPAPGCCRADSTNFICVTTARPVPVRRGPTQWDLIINSAKAAPLMSTAVQHTQHSNRLLFSHYLPSYSHWAVLFSCCSSRNSKVPRPSSLLSSRCCSPVQAEVPQCQTAPQLGSVLSAEHCLVQGRICICSSWHC